MSGEKTLISRISFRTPGDSNDCRTTVTLTPGGWHRSHQSGIIGITDQLIIQKRKQLRGVQGGQ